MRTLPSVILAMSSLILSTEPTFAVTSSEDTTTPFGGNGHNVSFDGRLFIVRRGPDGPTGGWFATVLRPENITFGGNGFPDFTTGAFSPFELIQPVEANENALAMCEPTPAPYACDASGAANAAGPFACYDLQVIDSDAVTENSNKLRRRALKVWVSNAGTGQAAVSQWEWGPSRDVVTNANGTALRGIEPSVTADGKLLVWQGHPDNDGKIDVLMYATNPNACAGSGWDGPHNLGAMFTDPNVNGVYPLGERALRAPDGSVYGPNDLLRGAYPWLFPDGEAINFTSVNVPCRGDEDPPGCGPRRGGIAVIGYPTNWALAHVDGAVNPDTDQTVRLFFSSPGPDTFTQIPVTPGVDVWPMFGSNTQNYTELVFDDGLDGRYAGIWHMNEMVDRNGDLDRSRTPDVSGYFNTGDINGANFPLRNNAPGGKALVFDGVGAHVFVPHDVSLDPVSGIALEMRVRLDAAVDCDGNNNYRVLLQKGGIGDGSYSLILEESGQLQARVKVGGTQYALVSSAALQVGQWTDVVLEYDAATGRMAFEFDGQPAGEAMHPPGELDGSSFDLTIGGPGGGRDACPNGDGAFLGAIDEVRIRRGSADSMPDPDPDPDPDPQSDMGTSAPDMGTSDTGNSNGSDLGGNAGGGSDLGGTQPDAGSNPGTSNSGSSSSDSGSEGGCSTAGGNSFGAALLALLALVGLRRRR